MAESVLFSLGSKILSTIASPAFQMAYEKGVSIWEAKDELSKLQVTMVTIHAVLLDAEKKQEGSDAVKEWIKRLKSVLYDAEDLFDEVATEDLLKQQMMGEGSNKLSLKKKVRVSCSKLNPIVSRNSIAKRVKAIRKSLVDISTDMAQFEFVRCQEEKPRFFVGKGRDPGCFVDARDVIGRDGDKEAIFEMLINKSSDIAKSDDLVVIAIVGIGGMGKTTLAQLVYNDEKIRDNFQNRWFACISDILDEREVLGKIFRSISGESYSDLDVGQLQPRIRELIEGKKCLLVLDDVWEDNSARWRRRMSLLSSCATGSRIIVTTRLLSAAKAVGALVTHKLEGLSEDDSWSLFKSLAFDEGYDRDPRRESLGREILKKCSGVPLAIQSIGSLLFLNNTITEWEAIEKEDLPTLGRNYNDETMSVLKLSYDHLPSHLKHCFAYCCLFPEDHVFSKLDLINHWIAQGYIEPNDGESSFMHLLRRGFFQEAEEDEFGEIESYKMHDLMHDLAMYVAGEESVVLSSTSLKTSSRARHVSFRIAMTDGSCDISTLMLNGKSMRSLLLVNTSRDAMDLPKLDQFFRSVKMLRTLSLSSLRIENIPPSIGELKLMRYLDLSSNNFEKLPDSITNLVNLLSLNLECCENFRLWPLDFHKLTNLRYLNVEYCDELRLMPVGIGKMNHLQYLGDLKIEKGSELNALAGLLQQLRGELLIEFPSDIRKDSDVDGDICSWQLPVSLQLLEMRYYQGMRIPGWGNSGSTNNLGCLRLNRCTNVKYLPPLRCLPNLRWLVVRELPELEFMEEGDCTDYNFATSKFFPCLEELVLRDLAKLNRWWGKVEAEAEVTSSSTFVEFPLLRELDVRYCPKLEFNSFLGCPPVRVLEFDQVQEELTSTVSCSSSTSPSLEEITTNRCKWQLSLASLQELEFYKCSTLKSLHLTSPHIRKMYIVECNELMSIKLVVAQHLQRMEIDVCSELKSIELVEANTHTPSLWVLRIGYCKELKSLHIPARLIVGLEKLKITECQKLRLVKSILPSPFPLDIDGCRCTTEVGFDDVGGELIEPLSLLPVQDIEIDGCVGPIRFQGTPFTSVRRIDFERVDGLDVLHLAASPHLRHITLKNCKGLTSVEVDAPTSVVVYSCSELKNLHIIHPNSLERLEILNEIPAIDWDSISNLGECSCIRVMILKCVDAAFIKRLISSSAPSLQDIRIRMFENEGEATSFVEWGRDVNWNLVPNLCILELRPLPAMEELPQCLVQRKALGQLKITEYRLRDY